MKELKILSLSALLSILLVSCIGDQKTVVGQEFGDTTFINDNFQGNKKDFSELPNNLCEFLNENVILKTYDNATSVTFDDKSPFMNKNCQFAVIYFNDNSQFIKGSLFVTEIEDESDGWKEIWELKKKRFESAEYVKNIGLAAVWNGKQRKLEIKMKGYDVLITVPPKMTAKNQIDNKSNVKNVAIAIAKNTGLF